MQLTDLFIKRPVLATVISLLILTMGLRAIGSLSVMQYPFTENAVVTVTTAYTGADPASVAAYITTPLENSIAQASGIDYMTSSSTQGTSTITVNLLLNYDAIRALSDINTKVNAVLNQLPKSSQLPVITVTVGETIDSMYLGFYSKDLPINKITDYLIRVVQPKLQAVNGVQQAQILGNRVFAMRIWLDPQKMAAFNVSPSDVTSALEQNNFQSAAGATKGDFITININAETDLHNVSDFENMVVRQSGSTLVRLKDVATVQLGAKTYDASVYFSGAPAVFIGIFVTPEANPLQVANQVNKLFPEIKKTFPPGLNGSVVYDATKFIRASIKEVIKTIVEATIIVVIVIFLFIGSVRSVVIPMVTIPLSLVGVCSVMLALGYSVNTLTLLAMVLAIGLVVDDAIVVVENIHRHIEAGMQPFIAAIKGAREIFTPIIAMTITLAAVYAPIGFMGGLTGSLFKEFAFTLAGAVIVSGIIALTLSPMMCSKLLVDSKHAGRFCHWVDHCFEWLKQFYQRQLDKVLNIRPVMLLFALVVLISCCFLYSGR